jgi:hypothetical protein
MKLRHAVDLTAANLGEKVKRHILSIFSISD